MSRLRTRLAALERSAPTPACPACRDRRGRIVLVDVRRVGGELTRLGAPAPCGACGVAPEFVIEAVEPAA